MSSFRTHTNINNVVNAAVLIPGVFLTDGPEIYAVSIGMILSTCFMGPDTDMNGSIPDLLTGQIFWQLYSKVMPHRSFWSHFPGVSTLIRIVYVETIPAMLAFITGNFNQFAGIHKADIYWWILGGVLLADTLHYLTDEISTARKTEINQYKRATDLY